MNVSYPVLVNGVTQYVQSPYPVLRGVLVKNYSGDNILYDDTVHPLLVVPPGVTVPLDVDSLISGVRLRSLSNTTGYATIELSDTPYDTTHAPALQQLPGNVSITGNVVIPGTVTATIPGTVSTNDSTTQANTGSLLGLLPTQSTSFTLDNSNNIGLSILKASPGLSIIPTGITRRGEFSLSATAADGAFLYIFQLVMLSNNAGFTFPLQYPHPISANSTIYLSFTGAGTFVLRY